MNDDQDPLLQSLFDDTKQDLASQAFVTQVMSQIDRQRRWFIAVWVCVALMCIFCGWLLTPLLQNIVEAFTQSLFSTLVDLDSGEYSHMLAPFNSIAGVTTLVLLGLGFAYRIMFK